MSGSNDLVTLAEALCQSWVEETSTLSSGRYWWSCRLCQEVIEESIDNAPEDIKHLPDCPVLLAYKVLKETGLPADVPPLRPARKFTLDD